MIKGFSLLNYVCSIIWCFVCRHDCEICHGPALDLITVYSRMYTSLHSFSSAIRLSIYTSRLSEVAFSDLCISPLEVWSIKIVSFPLISKVNVVELAIVSVWLCLLGLAMIPSLLRRLMWQTLLVLTYTLQSKKVWALFQSILSASPSVGGANKVENPQLSNWLWSSLIPTNRCNSLIAL